MVLAGRTPHSNKTVTDILLHSYKKSPFSVKAPTLSGKNGSKVGYLGIPPVSRPWPLRPFCKRPASANLTRKPHGWVSM